MNAPAAAAGDMRTGVDIRLSLLSGMWPDGDA
jgi:hypothetical protein